MQTSTTKAAPAATEIPYEAALARIENGDLLAWKWRGFGREIIDVWTHVGTALWLHGRLCVVEAVVPRVRVIPVDTFKNFYWVPTMALWGSAQTAYALQQLGDSYSCWDCLIGYGGMPMDDWREQCAELAIRLAKHSCVDLGDRATPGACVRAALSAIDAELFYTPIPKNWHRYHANDTITHPPPESTTHAKDCRRATCATR